MLNKVTSFIRQQDLVSPGDTVICAVSGGADSVAMLFAFYLLKEKLDITLEAAHFNHNLRAEESDRDEAFVRSFCDQYDIPLHVGSGTVTPGRKGLEAAARDARYAFLRTLNGKIATAHTADDNAETILMHLIRGTGLKGLGGIAPESENLIRPMLGVTRADVEGFLKEYYLPHVEDSSNEGDAFLRNRIRHHVMPLLYAENPRLPENLTRMALRLREEEEFLAEQSQFETLPGVQTLRAMPKARRSRMLTEFLKKSGMKEPEDVHISLAESLVFSDRPSALGRFPGGLTLARNYDRLEVRREEEVLEPTVLPCPGEVTLSGVRIICTPAAEFLNTPQAFTVETEGPIWVTGRRSGDEIKAWAGTKSLKKVFIDRKIPAGSRPRIPVLRDENGILGVYSIGAHQDRIAKSFPAVTIRFEKTDI